MGGRWAMRLILLWTMIFVSLFLSARSEAKSDASPLRLLPTSKWVAEYQNDGCRLIRQFGQDENQVIVTFSRFSPGDQFNLTLAGEPFRMKSSGIATLQFGPNEREQRVDFLVGFLGPTMPAAIMSSAIRLAPMTEIGQSQTGESNSNGYYDDAKIGADREKVVTYLRARMPLHKPIQLELGAMDRPFAALNNCIDELMVHWGLDVEKHKKLKQKVLPIGDPGAWINSNDYPKKMLAEGQSSIVEYRLDVDENGQVVGCHIQETTRKKEFDDAVCNALVRSANFSPAIDAEGSPIRSYWNGRVHFQLTAM
ncbi:MAG: TonB family protein [Gammaproteobacteria bacterium]|jgi:TonB family protein|nr:MAG: TonB family protein [Gammaproteobacteria bacterium]